MIRKVSVLLVVMLFFATHVFAQDETPEIVPQGDVDYEARYEGIPFTRTEDGAFILGEEDAPVTVVEFADFMCPHCQNYQTTAHQFIEDYVKTGEARFEYRMFPIVNPTYSNLTAQLAECVDEQREGAFWPAHDLLYDLALSGNIGPDTTETLAETLDLDVDSLKACTETADQYQTDTEVGEAAGVSGTPATMVRTAEGELGWVRLEGRTFSGGGLPMEILTQVMEAEDLSTVVVVPQPLLASLLEGSEECSAPCWNGITPGETAWDEAVALLEEDDQTVDPQSVEDPNSDAKMFQWSSVGSEAASRMITQNGETVDSITLVAPAEITTAEVFEAFGEPTSALAGQTEQGAVVVNLFYPDQTLIFAAFVLPDADGEFVFSEESEILGVNLFAPSEFEAIMTEATVFEWEGFEALDTYLGQPAQ